MGAQMVREVGFRPPVPARHTTAPCWRRYLSARRENGRPAQARRSLSRHRTPMKQRSKNQETPQDVKHMIAQSHDQPITIPICSIIAEHEEGGKERRHHCEIRTMETTRVSKEAIRPRYLSLTSLPTRNAWSACSKMCHPHPRKEIKKLDEDLLPFSNRLQIGNHSCHCRDVRAKALRPGVNKLVHPASRGRQGARVDPPSHCSKTERR